MGVVAIPFPTTLVAEHLRDADGTTATVTYGLVNDRGSVGFAGLWIYVVTHARGWRAGPAGSAPALDTGLSPAACSSTWPAR